MFPQWKRPTLKPHNRDDLLKKHLVLLCVIFLAACQAAPGPTLSWTQQAGISLPAEVEVQEIPLSGPASRRSAEISGMAWYGDILILLPQFPDRFGERGSGAVFALMKSDVLNFLEGNAEDKLEPTLIPFFDGGLQDAIRGYEGFEAIAFAGNRLFLTIEASPKTMRGFLVSGFIQPDLSEIRIDASTLTEIPLQQNLSNFSDETLLIYKEKLLTIYEANGKKVNPFPVAHLFTLKPGLQGVLPFAQIEYRITDATPPNQEGIFWAINCYFPLDEAKLRPDGDLLAERYGLGKTHRENLTVERLIQFQIAPDAIRLVDSPPLQLRLEGDVAPRNWEAIAILEKQGFLLATDKFPRTILGFVPFDIK